MVDVIKKETRSQRPTIGQMAALMKVSRSTISRALSGSSEISEPVKARVREMARRLDYQPHAMAQSLARGRTMKIGVLVRNLYLEQNALLVQAIEEAVAARGYRISLGITGEDETKMAAHLDNFHHGQADGLILLTTAVPNALVTKLADQGYPVGMWGYVIPGYEHLQLIEVDEGRETRHVLEYLYGLGHRHFGALWQLKSGDLFQVGEFERFVRERSLPFSAVCEADHLFSIEEAEAAAYEVLTRCPRITALFALTDTIAVGAIHAAVRLGLKVPDDLSVVGCGDLPIGRYFLPAITTIRYPMAKIIPTCVSRMIDRIEGRPEKPRERIYTELLVRQSTGPAKPGTNAASDHE